MRDAAVRSGTAAGAAPRRRLLAGSGGALVIGGCSLLLAASLAGVPAALAAGAVRGATGSAGTSSGSSPTGSSASGTATSTGATGTVPPGTSNGVTSLTPAAALAAAAGNLRTAPNIDLRGSETATGVTIRLDLESAHAGKELAGSISIRIPRTRSVTTVRYVSLPSAFYVDGDKAFWTSLVASDSKLSPAQQQQLVATLAGKWLRQSKAQAKSLTKGFGPLANPRRFALSLLAPTGLLAIGTAIPLAGVEAVPVLAGNGSATWLPETGPLLPIEITSGIESLKLAPVGSVVPGANKASTVVSSGVFRFAYPAALAITAPARSTAA